VANEYALRDARELLAEWEAAELWASYSRPCEKAFAKERDWDGLDRLYDAVLRIQAEASDSSTWLAPLQSAIAKELAIIRRGIREMFGKGIDIYKGDPKIVALYTGFYYDGEPRHGLNLFLCVEGPEDTPDWPAYIEHIVDGPDVSTLFNLVHDEALPWSAWFYAEALLFTTMARVWEPLGDPKMPVGFAHDNAHEVVLIEPVGGYPSALPA
jgi:hypothetical protein